MLSVQSSLSALFFFRLTLLCKLFMFYLFCYFFFHIFGSILYLLKMIVMQSWNRSPILPNTKCALEVTNNHHQKNKDLRAILMLELLMIYDASHNNV